MSKREQVLIIEPANELVFEGPFHKTVTSTLFLKNPTDRKVCFKIKTTAPKRYCVKPNSGIVLPNAEFTIAVSLQPFEYNPAEKNKHKFMVQSMFAPEGDFDQEALWKETDPAEMMDSKLKCVFNPTTNEAVVNHTGIAKPENPEVKPPLAAAKAPVNSQPTPTSNNTKGVEPEHLNSAVQELQRANESLSKLRQENLLLREETLRLKRVAAASGTPGFSSTTATPTMGSGETISTVYIYAALIVLVVGMILGKYFL